MQDTYPRLPYLEILRPSLPQCYSSLYHAYFPSSITSDSPHSLRSKSSLCTQPRVGRSEVTEGEVSRLETYLVISLVVGDALGVLPVEVEAMLY